MELGRPVRVALFIPWNTKLHLTTLTYGGDAMGRLTMAARSLSRLGCRGNVCDPSDRGETQLCTRRVGGDPRASPKRIAPRCVHFGVCGGCHYQNLPYEEQLKAKTDILRDQLTRIGKIENPACARRWSQAPARGIIAIMSSSI